MKVFLNSADVIGASMAGPGIRYLEMAKALATKHSITIAMPNNPELTDINGINFLRFKGWGQIKNHDVIITQFVVPDLLLAAKRFGVRIIVDAYDPVTLENLETNSLASIQKRTKFNEDFVLIQTFSLNSADAIICASEKQRDLWIGALSTLGRITPELYDFDKSLRSFIDVVPFGLPATSPRKTGIGPREQFRLNSGDFVLLWGGGIWNWFDPLSLIEAVASLQQKRTDIKLVFMSVKHPSESFPDMEMAKAATDLAEHLGVKDSSVFFNYNWVPYAQRANYLLDADVGVSTHFNHLETSFSFRTRILDYIWAGLPIISTQGDSFAELILQKNLGVVVDFENTKSIATAIEFLADDKERYKFIKGNLANIKNQYQWENITQVLEGLLQTDFITPPKKIYSMVAGYYVDKARILAREDGILALIKKIYLVALLRAKPLVSK